MRSFWYRGSAYTERGQRPIHRWRTRGTAPWAPHAHRQSCFRVVALHPHLPTHPPHTPPAAVGARRGLLLGAGGAAPRHHPLPLGTHRPGPHQRHRVLARQLHSRLATRRVAARGPRGQAGPLPLLQRLQGGAAAGELRVGALDARFASSAVPPFLGHGRPCQPGVRSSLSLPWSPWSALVTLSMTCSPRTPTPMFSPSRTRSPPPPPPPPHPHVLAEHDMI